MTSWTDEGVHLSRETFRIPYLWFYPHRSHWTHMLHVKRMRVTMVLPYLGPISVFIKRRVTKLVSKFYPLVDLKIIYRRGRTIGSLFPYKDRFPLKCNSHVVYKTQCEACGSSATYVGKTINTVYERFHGTNGHLHPSIQCTLYTVYFIYNCTVYIPCSCTHK